MLPNLHTFLTDYPLRNSYIQHKDFKSLYLRYSYYPFKYNEEYYIPKAIQIANIEAKHPRKGAFKKLLKVLLEYNMPIVIECVHNKEFAAWLENNNFVKIKDDPTYIIGV